MADTSTLPAGLGLAALGTPQTDADVGNELGEFGMGLGDLIKHVGKAVAETQDQLNKTMVETARRLAETKVKVVAVRERHYDDDGTVTVEHDNAKVLNHHMELPAIALMNSPGYMISDLRMQGEFQASEWKAHTASETDYTSTGGRVSLFVGSPVGQAGSQLMGIAGQMGVSALGMGANLTGLGGGGSASFYHNATSTRATTDTSTDVSYGSMRMNALITPTEGIGVPKPTQVFKGPSIGVLPGDPLLSGDKTASSLDVMIVYQRPATREEREDAPETSRYPIAGKPVIIEVPGCRWQYLPHPEEDEKELNPKVTGKLGTLHIRLSRDFPFKDPGDETSGRDTEQKTFVLSARVGMVRTDTTLRF
jgi:hypothetical protein